MFKSLACRSDWSYFWMETRYTYELLFEHQPSISQNDEGEDIPFAAIAPRCLRKQRWLLLLLLLRAVGGETIFAARTERSDWPAIFEPRSPGRLPMQPKLVLRKKTISNSIWPVDFQPLISDVEVWISLPWFFNMSSEGLSRRELRVGFQAKWVVKWCTSQLITIIIITSLSSSLISICKISSPSWISTLQIRDSKEANFCHNQARRPMKTG